MNRKLVAALVAVAVVAGLAYGRWGYRQSSVSPPAVPVGATLLDGLGLLNRDVAKAVMAADPKARGKARATHAALVAEYSRAAARCLQHRHYLQTLSMETSP